MSHDPTTNGHGTNALVRLRRLLEEHERAVAALRYTLALLDTQATTDKRATHTAVLSGAIALDRQRVQHKARTGGMSKERRATRERTGALLAAMGTAPMTAAEASSVPHIGNAAKVLHILARHGYLKRRGTGKDATYTRTTRVFTP